MPYTSEQLAIMGEENTKPIVPFPRLNFDGNMGVLAIDRGEREVEIMDKLPLECVLLSVRVSYKLFVKDAYKKPLYMYFTNEGKSQQSEFILKKNEKGQPLEIIDRAIGKELQDTYGLKMVQCFYLLMKNGEVLKLDVQGKGLGNAFDYYKQFENDEHKIDFKCLIDVKQEEFEDENEEKSIYYALTFNKGEKVNEEAKPIIFEKLEMLSSRFSAMDKLPVVIPKKEKEKLIESIAPQKPDEEETNEDEFISISEIPF